MIASLPLFHLASSTAPGGHVLLSSISFPNSATAHSFPSASPRSFSDQIADFLLSSLSLRELAAYRRSCWLVRYTSYSACHIYCWIISIAESTISDFSQPPSISLPLCRFAVAVVHFLLLNSPPIVCWRLRFCWWINCYLNFCGGIPCFSSYWADAWWSCCWRGSFPWKITDSPFTGGPAKTRMSWLCILRPIYHCISWGGCWIASWYGSRRSYTVRLGWYRLLNSLAPLSPSY